MVNFTVDMLCAIFVTAVIGFTVYGFMRTIGRTAPRNTEAALKENDEHNKTAMTASAVTFAVCFLRVIFNALASSSSDSTNIPPAA